MSASKVSLGPSRAQQEAANARNLARWNGEVKWDWRKFLTSDEREVVRAAEDAKAKWQQLNNQMAGIRNRAIHRAKYAALRSDPKEGE